MNITEVFLKITAALDRAGIEYMLAGSFASTRYSSPRSTQDIDIVILATPAQLSVLIEDLRGKNYYAELDEALEARKNESLFNVIDQNSGWKIDLIFCKSTAFGQEEFRRRRKIELHGVQMSVASPEDIIIAKLQWSKQGGSHRQLEDAASVLRVQGEALDVSYLGKWIAELGLNGEWERVRGIAESD